MQASRDSMKDVKEEDDDDDSDVDVAFANMDFGGVDFDGDDNKLSAAEQSVLEWEAAAAFQDYSWGSSNDTNEEGGESAERLKLIRRAGTLVGEGKYTTILRDEAITNGLFSSAGDVEDETSVMEWISRGVEKQVESSSSSFIVEGFRLQLLGISSLNLFLQSNYTGPTLEEDLTDINPHKGTIASLLKATRGEEPSSTIPQPTSDGDEAKQTTEKIATKSDLPYQNSILAELAADGEWPCPVCEYPYFLLVARAILTTLSKLTSSNSNIKGIHLWNARSVVAHQRLLQSKPGEAPPSLSKQLDDAFERSLSLYRDNDQKDSNDDDNGNQTSPNPQLATVLLEQGLADHHWDRAGKGRQYFVQAQHKSGLEVEVTGAYGKRTKFQQEAKAQMLVRARSTIVVESNSNAKSSAAKEDTTNIMVAHPEEEILLERIKFEDEKENEIQALNELDQSILLALCLDVKNNNPTKEALTAEEMGAFLARVLDHHDDWMIYATALLERSWLEFERSHAKERAILQMQALADQHTNRLTFTQSTKKSIEEDSAPIQKRLQHLHTIVYPPRWAMIQEIADRYESLGIVTSAAELYTEIELWDDVVECYSRAGKRQKAEQIVRTQLSKNETPRMWTALGDLTGDIEHYEKAIELSNRRFAKAFIALGQHYFDKKDLRNAFTNYAEALSLRPLMPHIWFRYGTICMQLEEWDAAFRAFSEVVRQEPEEAEAWANVAAIHMHNKNPSEAYPALNESLKHNRNNWRVWVSKLYTCLDLEKYDEAVQACNSILDLRLSKAQSDGIPPLEEKCVRAIVGGACRKFQVARTSDSALLEPLRRTLLRVHALLDRIGSSSATMPWVFESLAYLHQQVGADDKVLEYLMQEYRTLQGVPGWERDIDLRKKMYDVVAHIVSLRQVEGSKDSLVKSRMLLRGVKKKVEDAALDAESMPKEVEGFQSLLTGVEEKLNEL